MWSILNTLHSKTFSKLGNLLSSSRGKEAWVHRQVCEGLRLLYPIGLWAAQEGLGLNRADSSATTDLVFQSTGLQVTRYLGSLMGCEPQLGTALALLPSPLLSPALCIGYWLLKPQWTWQEPNQVRAVDLWVLCFPWSRPLHLHGYSKTEMSWEKISPFSMLLRTLTTWIEESLWESKGLTLTVNLMKSRTIWEMGLWT